MTILRKRAGNLLAEIYSLRNYILCIGFQKIFFVCEYQLWVQLAFMSTAKSNFYIRGTECGYNILYSGLLPI
jgi:hypothetical protein